MRCGSREQRRSSAFTRGTRGTHRAAECWGSGARGAVKSERGKVARRPPPRTVAERCWQVTRAAGGTRDRSGESAGGQKGKSRAELPRSRRGRKGNSPPDRRARDGRETGWASRLVRSSARSSWATRVNEPGHEESGRLQASGLGWRRWWSRPGLVSRPA